jgi:hypothetical protein
LLPRNPVHNPSLARSGGQELDIFPGLELVVVTMASNYHEPDAWKLPVAILEEFLLPALRRE